MRTGKVYLFSLLAALIAASSFAVLITPSSAFADKASACKDVKVSLVKICEYSYDNPRESTVVNCDGYSDSRSGRGAKDACAQGREAALDEEEAAANGQNPGQPGQPGPPGPPGQNDTITCAIEKIGWIACPVMEALGRVADTVYEMFLNKLLKVEEVSTDTSGPLYKAWAVMRNFANIAFVAAFLVVIYSQVTGFGISNYGIKKILPRLILVVMLVNLSYWICAIAVDLSNIIGSQLYVMLKELQASPELNFEMQHNGTFVEGKGWTGLVIAVVATGAVVYAGLTILLPALIFILMALVTVVVTLTLRQALIIMLIMIAPLAFVAYLLPNTESLFKKWFSLFRTLLVMYPLIALIAGGSAIASNVVMNTSDEMLVQVMGASIVVVPLMITPLVMKTAGGLMNRFGGIVNNPNKGPFDRMRKGAKDLRDNRQNLRRLRGVSGEGPALPGYGKAQRFKARRQAINDGRKQELERARGNYIDDLTSKDPKFANKVAGGTMFNPADPRALQRVQSVSQLKADKATAEIVEANKISLKNADTTELRQIALDANQSLERRTAAMQLTVDNGDFKGLNDMIDSVGKSNSRELRNALADSIKNSKNKPGYIGQGDIATLRNGDSNNTVDSRSMIRGAIEKNTYSPERMASADKDELAIIGNYAVNDGSGLSMEHRQNFVNNANAALNDPQLARQLSKNKGVISSIKNLEKQNLSNNQPQ